MLNLSYTMCLKPLSSFSVERMKQATIKGGRGSGRSHRPPAASGRLGAQQC